MELVIAVHVDVPYHIVTETSSYHAPVEPPVSPEYLVTRYGIPHRLGNKTALNRYVQELGHDVIVYHDPDGIDVGHTVILIEHGVANG